MPHMPIVTRQRVQQIRTKYVQQSKEKRQIGKSIASNMKISIELGREVDVTCH